MNNKVDITFLIPSFNESGNIISVYEDIRSEFKNILLSYEIIFIDDGSTDNSKKKLAGLKKKNKSLKYITLSKNIGKARALEGGISYAEGKYLIVMDGDFQYRAKDALKIYKIAKKGYKVVSGLRVNRKDKLPVKIFSYLYNTTLYLLTMIYMKDAFSGLKCMELKMVRSLSLNGGLYRFIIFYAKRNGFKTTEVPISHYPRFTGETKYNFIGRIKLAISDILTIFLTISLPRKFMYQIMLSSFLALFLFTIIFFLFKGITNLLIITNIYLIAVVGILLYVIQKKFYQLQKKKSMENEILFKQN